MNRTCPHCQKEFKARKSQAFCSVRCGALNRADAMKGPRLDEPREKPCEQCGAVLTVIGCQNNLAKFRLRRFCGKRCSAMACRPRGEAHPMWKAELTEKQRTSRGPQQAWAYRVKTRDGWQCTKCGQKGGRLEAHHIHEFSSNVELRWDVENGITLCWTCHTDLHATERVGSNNAVNSVKPSRPVQPRDNTEPSLGGNALEGVTTRGRAYGLWQGNCSECGVLFFRQFFRVKGKSAVYCTNSCAGKARNRHRYGSNASTSAAHRKVKR